MTLSAGDRFGAYEILGVVGAGGMGVVYRALDTRLRREVALKLLPDVADGDATSRARLMHEARAAAALNHPNICTIHEVGDVDGVPYIAMEFIGGETLRAILRRRPMSPDRVCRIGRHLADALEHAHAHGIIHRDFKTANVMITSDGRAKVLDFGIAAKLRVSDDATRTVTFADANDRMAGTLAYMAPEVLQGQGADVRSDVWALGAVLHEMTSGRTPFEGQTDSAAVAAILRDAPAPLPAGTPSGLARIIERCLAKEPEQRPARAGEVGLALDVVDPQLTSTRGTTEWRRLALIVPLAVLLLALGLGAWRLRSGSLSVDDAIVRLANPVQVTNAVGVEEFAAWSPDGRTLAYSSSDGGGATGGSWDIWVTQVGGGAAINRTADYAGRDQFPSWSPDGTQIAFSSDRDGGGCYVMSALAGPPRKVAAASPADPNPPQWSSDGRTLTCVGGTATIADVFVDVVSLDTGASQQRVALPGDGRRFFVTRSRDERTYAFVSAPTGLAADVNQLWVLHTPTNRAFAVTDGRTKVASPSWSPDGRWLYYVSNAGRSMELWRQRIGTDDAAIGAPQPITAGIGMRNAVISSDGARVAYSQGRRLSNIWRAPILPSRPATWADATQVTFDQAYIESFDVSRDGKRLAISSDRSGNQDLWTLPAEGDAMQQLTTEPTPEWAPRWSPDHSTLAFHAYRTGNREIFTMPASGGPWTQVTNDPGADVTPAWSPDGTQIANQAGRPFGAANIQVSPASGGESRLVVRMQTSGNDWSPVDDRIAFVFRGALWMVHASGAAPPVAVADGSFGGLRWLPDGKRLLSRAPRDGAPVVVSIADDGTGERRVMNFTGRRGSLGSLATDGRFLYFTWSEDIGDLWVMDVIENGK